MTGRWINSAELNLHYEALAAIGPDAAPSVRLRYVDELRRRRAEVAAECHRRRSRDRLNWQQFEERRAA